MLVQLRRRGRTLGVGDAHRLRDVDAEVLVAASDAFGDELVVVEHADSPVVAGLDAQGRLERRRQAERHLGGTVDASSDEPARVPAVAAVRRTAEAPVDADGIAHARASSFLTAAAPASADSRSSACGMRLNMVQPASTYGARNSATSSGVPYGEYFSNRSNGIW